ncbi:glycosyltransferase family 2 protein [Butyrivibrio sp. INlla16]|uniref:glycosyltransferase n=1 Tax=Butyrivibrio sp. INlla16 TaxID=1520807 RepID=UPI0008906543|nr:glycosyltransferase family 2 protein [Butyrivibrio sp. INlla16]SDB66473.1 Glycosyltransferase involved in cell wall bisynthesis [Butyrivibrio sp. INlla16]
MNKPFFSLILPIYNVEAYLQRCVDSIISQNFDDYEIILVDDGSTDSCPALCDEICTTDERIRVIHKKNGGLSSARNAGIEVANGEYVFYIDSDDWIEPNALLTLHNTLENGSCDILKFNFKYMPSGKEEKSSIMPGKYDANDIHKWIVKESLVNTGEVICSAWSHVYRLEFLKTEDIVFVSEREIGSEDYLYNLETYLKAKSMVVIPDIIYNYDFREGSLTQKYRDKLYEQYKNLNSGMHNVAKKCGDYENLKNALYSSYIGKCFYVVLRNECKITSTHTRNDSFRKIKEILNHNELREALKDYKSSDLSRKEKIMLFVLKYKMRLIIYLWMSHSLNKKSR